MSDLPSGWEWARLGNLGDEVRGSVRPEVGTIYELYSVPTYPTGKPEVLTGEKIGSSKRPVQPGDVLLCKINPRINRVWSVAQFSHEFPQIASTEYLVFRTQEPRLGSYLRWYLQGPTFRRWIELSVEGATGSHTRAKSGPILEQLVPVPPVEEQQRIVAAIEEHLSRLDAAVVLLSHIPPRLNQLMWAPAEEAWRDRDLRRIALGEVGCVVTGATPKSTASGEWGEDHLFATPGDLDHGGRLVRTRRRLSVSGFEAARSLLEGSVLVTCIGATLGKSAMTTSPTAFNQQINGLMPHPGVATPGYLLAILAVRAVNGNCGRRRPARHSRFLTRAGSRRCRCRCRRLRCSVRSKPG